MTSQGSPGNLHPAPDMLMALDTGVLPEELVGQIHSHLGTCRVCAQLRRDLMHQAGSEPSIGELERLRKRVFPAAAVRMRRARLAAAAAAIAAALVAGLLIRRTESPRGATLPEPATKAYRLALSPAPLRLPLAAAIIMRGQQDDSSERYLKALGSALEPYRAGRYVEAAAQLASLRVRYPRSVEPAFYQGVSQLLAGEASAALEPLRAAEGIGGEALHDDILWYQAVARERTGAWQEAVPLLHTLCRSEGVYRNAACEGGAQQ